MFRPLLLMGLLCLPGCTAATLPQAPDDATMAARDTGLLKPAPNAQGRLIATDRGTDVAIQGDAMFVFSRTRTPGGIGELVVSRRVV